MMKIYIKVKIYIKIKDSRTLGSIEHIRKELSVGTEGKQTI